MKKNLKNPVRNEFSESGEVPPSEAIEALAGSPAKTELEADAPRFLEGYLPYLLAQASSRVSREFHREVKAAGLSVTEWRILASLFDSKGESVGALSQLTLTKQSTLSKVVQRMEQDGLVTRSATRADRRQTLVRITERGITVTQALIKRAEAHQRAVLKPFGVVNSEILVDVLRQLLALHPASEVSAGE